MSTWHVDDDLAGRYAAGATDLVLAASVEAHLLECPTCQASVTAMVSPQRLDDIWARVTDKLEASPTPAERLLRRWRRARPLSARLAIAFAAAVAFVAAPLDLDSGHLPGGPPPAGVDAIRHLPGGSTPPSGPAQTRPAAHNLIGAQNDPGLAALTAGLTSVGGRLMSSYDPPPHRITLDDDIQPSANVTERNIRGVDHNVVPRSAVIHSASGAWIYTITGPRTIVRQRITVSAEYDGVAALSDGPPAGTGVLTLTIA